MEKKIYWNYIGFIFIACALFMGYFVFMNLDKGLIFNDEAYYLFHFREYKNILTVDSSNFFRIFQPFYTDNVYHFRIITYVLLNISSFLLFFFSAKFFKLKIHPILLGFLGISINYITWTASNVVLQQYFGNTILVNLTLIFLLVSLIYKKDIFLPVAGFFLGILLFDGVPHATVFAPFALFLLYVFGKKDKIKILFFALGVLVAILYYFLFIQSFSSFISQLEYLKIYKSFHRKQHPISFFFYWFASVLGFIFVPGIIICGGIHRFAKDKIKVINIFIAILFAVYIYTYLFNPLIYFNYFFLLILTYKFLLSKNTSVEKALIITLFTVPFCLSFGSGAYFDARANVYSLYFFLTVIVIIAKIYSIRVFAVFAVLYSCSVISFPTFTESKGWKDFIFEDQTVPVKINGHILYLDKQRNKDIEDLRPYLQNQPKVIYSSNHLMGYLYILNAKPPIPYYFALKKYVEFIIEKKGDKKDDYIYIESDDYPFTKNEIQPLQFVHHPEDYTTINAGRFIIYLPKKFQKK